VPERITEKIFRLVLGGLCVLNKKFALHNIRVIGEAGSADEDEAQKFVDSFDSLIKEGYLPEQIFSVDERNGNACLIVRTYIKKQKGCQDSKQLRCLEGMPRVLS
jgi:hypothetical protein